MNWNTVVILMLYYCIYSETVNKYDLIYFHYLPLINNFNTVLMLMIFFETVKCDLIYNDISCIPFLMLQVGLE